MGMNIFPYLTLEPSSKNAGVLAVVVEILVHSNTLHLFSVFLLRCPASTLMGKFFNLLKT
jgi:hypothetical protein